MEGTITKQPQSQLPRNFQARYMEGTITKQAQSQLPRIFQIIYMEGTITKQTWSQLPLNFQVVYMARTITEHLRRSFLGLFKPYIRQERLPSKASIAASLIVSAVAFQYGGTEALKSSRWMKAPHHAFI
jgi:hypothetical protein